jgi:RNA polymerase-binding transcription factor DksA
MEREFLLNQRRRIQRRINAAKENIRNGRSDSVLKACYVLPALDIAFARTFTGLYGQCIDCKNKISRVRLENTPGVIRCLDCQKSHEK